MNNAQVLTLPILRTFKPSLSPGMLWILIGSVVFSLLVVCIIQLNSYTREVYLIQAYESQLVQMEEEGRFLEVNFSRVNSLDNMGSYSQLFEKAGEIEYIRVLEDTALAK